MDCTSFGIHPLGEFIKDPRWHFSVPSVISVVSN